jgi:hypothetical protein
MSLEDFVLAFEEHVFDSLLSKEKNLWKDLEIFSDIKPSIAHLLKRVEGAYH